MFHRPLPLINAGLLFNLFPPLLLTQPHFPTWAVWLYPHSPHETDKVELSSLILSKEPQDSGNTSVRLVKYWITASPVLLATVATWNVRPSFLLQWNLSCVNGRYLLSSFKALMVIRTLLLLCSLIFRYNILEDSSTVESFVATMLETRSHPPPSVFISQKTFNGFPKLPGSIQYSPSPTENPLSKRCLQDFPGEVDSRPTLVLQNCPVNPVEHTQWYPLLVNPVWQRPCGEQLWVTQKFYREMIVYYFDCVGGSHSHTGCATFMSM